MFFLNQNRMNMFSKQTKKAKLSKRIKPKIMTAFSEHPSLKLT